MANAPSIAAGQLLRARAGRDDVVGGSDINDGERRIEIRHGRPNQLHHVAGGTRRPHDDVHIGIGPLGSRYVDGRFGLLVEATFTHVPDHANDGLCPVDTP